TQDAAVARLSDEWRALGSWPTLADGTASRTRIDAAQASQTFQAGSSRATRTAEPAAPTKNASGSSEGAPARIPEASKSVRTLAGCAWLIDSATAVMRRATLAKPSRKEVRP